MNKENTDEKNKDLDLWMVTIKSVYRKQEFE